MITACQHDAYAREGISRVLKATPAERGWHVWLDDSVLFAEGGGQPSDRGTLDGVPVWSVSATPDGLLHHVAEPVGTGEVKVVVDWARRFDHMQQHSGQHLLTALALARFGWRTTSFHLHEGDLAACDIALDAEPTPSELAALQDDVNAAIREARPVTTRLVDQLSDEVRSRGLPAGHQGPVRLVEIAGLDVNTCGGTHVRSTAELQALALLGTERIRGGTRLSWVYGGRVLARLAAAEQRTNAAAALLSRGPVDLVACVERVLEDAKTAGKARQAIADELADTLGASLAAGSGVRILHRDEGDAAFLNRIAAVVLRSDPAATVWLTAGSGREGMFLLAAAPERVGALRAQILELLAAKGGGPAGRLQGRAARLDRRAGVEALLR